VTCKLKPLKLIRRLNSNVRRPTMSSQLQWKNHLNSGTCRGLRNHIRDVAKRVGQRPAMTARPASSWMSATAQLQSLLFRPPRSWRRPQEARGDGWRQLASHASRAGRGGGAGPRRGKAAGRHDGGCGGRWGGPGAHGLGGSLLVYDYMSNGSLAHVACWFQFLAKCVPIYEIQSTTHGTLLVLKMCMKLAIYFSRTRGFDIRIFVVRIVKKLPQPKRLLVLEQSLDSASVDQELHDVITRHVPMHKLMLFLLFEKISTRET
jgi:hypothetical protein